MNARRLLGQSAHSGLFFILNYASRLFLAIALGKTLSVQEYGIYSLIGVFIATSTSFLPLGVTNYYVREIPGRSSSSAMRIFKGVVGVQVALFFVFVGFALFVPALRTFFSQWLGLPKRSALVFGVCLLLLSENLAADFGRYLFFRKKIQQGNVVSFLQYGLWGYAAFCIFLFRPARLNLQVLLLLWGISLGMALFYGGWRVNLKRLIAEPFEPKLYPTALRFGFPLLASSLLAIVNVIARFTLAKTHSAEVVGIYTYHYNIALMIGAISSPIIGNPLDPYAIEAYNTGNAPRSSYLLGASLRYRILLVVPFLIVASVWSRELIHLMAKSDYAIGNGLLAALAPIPVLSLFSSTFERTLFLMRKTGTIARCYLIAGAVQLILSLVLIPRHPYFGIALATNAGLFTHALLLWQASRQTDLSIETALGRFGLATVSCCGIAWVVAHFVSALPPFILLATVTPILAVSYFLLSVLFRALSRKELEKLWSLLRESIRTLGLPYVLGRSG